jgi:glycosyltransferase involved in cell wall biosynthesis
MTHSTPLTAKHSLVCFSHLRWNFVFQRPQHLMSRFARHRRVFFVEEPVYFGGSAAWIDAVPCPRTGVIVVRPCLPEDWRWNATKVTQGLLARFFAERDIEQSIIWFYTPMAMDLLPSDVQSAMVVYDCMDELSGFLGAPTDLSQYEQRLLKAAHLVFTGGVSLFEAKRKLHPQVHAFPSGVDVEHFLRARRDIEEPADQMDLGRPRLGFAGVIDERMDLNLMRGIAERRPDWQIVMLGPVVKIDPNSLPRNPNIHWLGMKEYQELPRYFKGWDVGMIPFALNDATRFISPTKTPEYLAAGLPVVSTPIKDVVRPYGELGLAHIARDAEGFVTEAEHAMTYGMSLKWRERADQFLKSLSWDATWSSMNRLIEETLRSHNTAAVSQLNQGRRQTEVAGV